MSAGHQELVCVCVHMCMCVCVSRAISVNRSFSAEKSRKSLRACAEHSEAISPIGLDQVHGAKHSEAVFHMGQTKFMAALSRYRLLAIVCPSLVVGFHRHCQFHRVLTVRRPRVGQSLDLQCCQICCILLVLRLSWKLPVLRKLDSSRAASQAAQGHWMLTSCAKTQQNLCDMPQGCLRR